MNHVQRILRQLQPRQFFPREPSDFGGVAGGGKISRNPAAEKINQNVVILHALLGIAQDAIVDAEEFAGFDGESGFFAGLADCGFAHQFANFEHASGDGPFGLQRRVSALYQDDAGVFDDDGAYADQRRLRGIRVACAKDSKAWVYQCGVILSAAVLQAERRSPRRPVFAGDPSPG